MGPRIFRIGDPTVPLRVRGMSGDGRPILQVRSTPRSFGGFGSPPPGPNGEPGNFLYPYGEQSIWGDGSGPGATPISQPPIVGAPQDPNPPNPPSGYSDISTPTGESDRPWTNPNTYATVPLTGALSLTGTQLTPLLPVLSGNGRRSALIIQNTSTAGAGDTAPTLYVDFNHQPQIGGSLTLPPGLGFFWGAHDGAPRDSIFVAFGGFSNAGGSVVVSGCVIQGTYDPNPTPPRNPMAQYTPPRLLGT